MSLSHGSLPQYPCPSGNVYIMMLSMHCLPEPCTLQIYVFLKFIIFYPFKLYTIQICRASVPAQRPGTEQVLGACLQKGGKERMKESLLIIQYRK
jgi:hypothetical protein